jgi:hypothetical protein
MWKEMPVNAWGCDDSKFMSWQGCVFALLDYNQALQSEFRDAVKLYRPKMPYYEVSRWKLKSAVFYRKP